MSYNTCETNETDRCCPHCGQRLESWIGPPETMWGLVLVCNNNQCPYYLNSAQTVENFGGHPSLSFRYAEDPENNYASFNLLSYCPAGIRESEGSGCDR